MIMNIKPKLTTQENEILTLLLIGRYKVNVQYLGFDHKKEMDSWLFDFSNENWNKTERFFFYTGIGHRFIKKSNYKYPKPCHTVKHITNNDLKMMQAHSKKFNTFFGATVSVMEPEIASLLHSLVLDSQAKHESFNDWCDNFGYNNDSLKALNTYQECCKIADQLYGFFPRDTVKKFESILEDY